MVAAEACSRAATGFRGFDRARILDRPEPRHQLDRRRYHFRAPRRLRSYVRERLSDGYRRGYICYAADGRMYLTPSAKL